MSMTWNTEDVGTLASLTGIITEIQNLNQKFPLLQTTRQIKRFEGECGIKRTEIEVDSVERPILKDPSLSFGRNGHSVNAWV
jgi:hypothetical protein